MFVHWFRDMMFDKNDRRFNVLEYMKFSDKEDPNVGKYNAGQKFFFWAAAVGALALLLSGVVLWWPSYFFAAAAVRLHPAARPGLHRVLRGHRRHIYLGTAAEPGTVPRHHPGTVSKAWARLHHPRWYREVTGDRRS